eukprot:7311016-Alexandrium_andersonii.AAC.1
MSEGPVAVWSSPELSRCSPKLSRRTPELSRALQGSVVQRSDSITSWLWLWLQPGCDDSEWPLS